MPSLYVTCPFCGEDDYDLIGLKMHIVLGHCEIYNNLGSNYKGRLGAAQDIAKSSVQQPQARLGQAENDITMELGMSSTQMGLKNK